LFYLSRFCALTSCVTTDGKATALFVNCDAIVFVDNTILTFISAEGRREMK